LRVAFAGGEGVSSLSESAEADDGRGEDASATDGDGAAEEDAEPHDGEPAEDSDERYASSSEDDAAGGGVGERRSASTSNCIREGRPLARRICGREGM